MKKLLLCFLFAFGCASSVQAEGIFPDKPHIYVEGKGEVKVEADRVTISCGLRAKNKTMALANADMQAKSSKLMKLIEDLKLDVEKVRADGTDLDAMYKYDDDGNETDFLGYEATRTVRITLTKFKQHPEIMRSLSSSKLVDSLRSNFYVKDAEEKMLQARDEALDNARVQAERMAKKLGAKVGKVYSVTEIDVRDISDYQLKPTRSVDASDVDFSDVKELSSMYVSGSRVRRVAFIMPDIGKATAKVYVVFLLK